MVSGSSDKTVRVWDAATGTPFRDPVPGHTGWVATVAVGHLGDRPVLVSGGSDKSVRTWTVGRLAVGEPERRGNDEVIPRQIDLDAHVLGVAFSGPGQFVAATDLGIVTLQIRGSQ